MIIEVIPEKRTSPGKDFFSYLVPEELRDKIDVGSVVDIPFGNKKIRGVVAKTINQKDKRDFDYKLKSIIQIYDGSKIFEKYLKISQWLSTYYLCSLGEAVSLFLPPKIKRPNEKNSKTTSAKSCEIKLNAEQDKIFSKLTESLHDPKKPVLLHGVTGSGKTEIYLKLTSECLKMGKQVIILVPEIMLTPQIVERFESAFSNQICLVHSGLSKSKRYLSYQQFVKDEKKIMIGPRSALLVPSNNLGLIIVDEEQEDAYKQEKDPRYHAVTLAEKIARENKALLLLGTATPRIETFYKAKSGEYGLETLKNRYNKLLLPTTKIVDLKNELKNNNFSPISEYLKEKIESILKRKKQAILFLNRRGMSTFVSCRDCGYVAMCKKCSIPLVQHLSRREGILECHHCDFKEKAPAQCPDCGSAKIKFFGAGIERIENEIEKLYPKAKIKRIDSKTLQTKDAYKKLHLDIKNHKYDILIGTQILAKGIDFPKIDLVGIVSADVGLHMPYFRANERVFNLLTQVSGRSGRSENIGETVIQTYWPDSSAVKLSANHDYLSFYQKEIIEREKYCYPPFCHLIRIISEDKNITRAKEFIEKVAQKLKKEEIGFIGPGKCFFAKINNKYRFHIIIKTKKIPDIKIIETFNENPYITWDVDPVDML